MNKKEMISIFWFRRDLRLKDNHGLYKALSHSKKVLPVFIFDKNILDDLPERSDPRITFIYKKLQSIDNDLKSLGSGLSIHTGTPLQVFKELCSQFNVEKVFANKDYEPYGRNRDEVIKKYLNERSIDLLLYKDHVIYEENEVIKEDKTPYKVFTAYKRLWLSKFSPLKTNPFPSENLLNNLYKSKDVIFPSLSSIGFKYSKLDLPAEVIPLNIIQNYDKNRDFPAINGTTKLGIHLRFGTISIRKAVLIAYKNNDTWLNELIWREFYMMILFHFPNVVKESFKKEYDRIQWINDPNSFERWKSGQTGYPLVDAGMRELNATGYMHNRIRMLTASFLTKHLLIDWRLGEAYFAEKLLDFELSSNNGGWQWAAGTGTDAQPYFRVFNPTLQASRFDPNKVYIRKWVPEFLSEKYVKPIIDHTFARERAINTFKHALS
jgi:deoxyribodipyrimidine photo-lyase